MAGLTLIITAFDRNLVLSFGAEVAKEDTDDDKEVVVVESQGIISNPVGFVPNDEEEDEDDDGVYRSRGAVLGRPVGVGLR